jgi:hypothetical protein
MVELSELKQLLLNKLEEDEVQQQAMTEDRARDRQASKMLNNQFSVSG